MLQDMEARIRWLTRSVLRRVAIATVVTTLTTGGHSSAPAAASRPIVNTLVLSDQARRLLMLQHRSLRTEFMGCMIGEIRGGTVVVDRIAPADVEPSHSTATWVSPHKSCEDAGWTGTVGIVHTHPTGERCWYFFPSTRVASSDGESFARSPYDVDAIMCGDYVVWVGRTLFEQRIVFVRRPQMTGSILDGHMMVGHKS
ncbi:MAG TPA: Mov34/MPN/PAD-1 family protein [Gemmatimonadales bacterium]